MTDKWAVTQIHKDAKGRIERYRCVKQPPQPNVVASELSRRDIAAAILSGHEFWTAFADSHGGLRWGAPLEIVLKTHPDAKTNDNLEKLPTF